MEYEVSILELLLATTLPTIVMATITSTLSLSAALRMPRGSQWHIVTDGFMTDSAFTGWGIWCNELLPIRAFLGFSACNGNGGIGTK